MSSPRWKKCITDALAQYEKSTIFQLSTVDPIGPKPHVRSCVFRSFITPVSAPSLPLVLTTTDSRTPKTSQIIAHPAVELAWWIEGTEEQYRISGNATLIPEPKNSLHQNFLHLTRAVSPGSGMEALKKDGIDWEAKRLEVFRSMSPYMKASWCRPVPGSPLVGGQDEAKKWPVRVDEPGDGDSEADRENRKNWDFAFGNFSLLVIDPHEVDYVELAVKPNRRTRFSRTEAGQWEEQELVP
ncbi:hypothetical protein C8J56DRAFT_963534 [Mycena floridula]|nr:hypothetical protein C8J56DRAFT_963534 [Mycena floridula]